MNKSDIKYEAQDSILCAVSNTILMAIEDNKPAIRDGRVPPHSEELLKQMQKQGQRVVKLFGFDSFYGIE